MTAILLFGVTNVGKSTVGAILAEKLGYDYYDLDDEIKKLYHITLEEFVHTGTIEQRDAKRGKLIGHILQRIGDKVLAITPMSYPEHFERYLEMDGVIAIELRDTAKNIFDRLVFSDENDIIYTDDEYKMERKDYYMGEIRADQEWYGRVFERIEHKYDMDNDAPEIVADKLIETLNL